MMSQMHNQSIRKLFPNKSITYTKSACVTEVQTAVKKAKAKMHYSKNKGFKLERIILQIIRK